MCSGDSTAGCLRGDELDCPVQAGCRLQLGQHPVALATGQARQTPKKYSNCRAGMALPSTVQADVGPMAWQNDSTLNANSAVIFCDDVSEILRLYRKSSKYL